jgi:N-glycosylase/DNA lyase
MVHALVEHLGEPAVGGTGRAFPTPEALVSAGDVFLRDVARTGYRGPYLIALAHQVMDGLDLEKLDPSEGLDDDEVYEQLQDLPGVGPYAAAHIMMMLGRHSRLILDSWTRPKYARLVGRRRVADATIVRRFRGYGPYAGLAFWLFLTRDWVEDT